MTNKLLTLEEIEKIEKFRAEMIELEPESCRARVFGRKRCQNLITINCLI